MQEDAIKELKHAILVHSLLAGGPSPELACYTIKIIDFLDDMLAGKDSSREILMLAFSITKSAAYFVYKSHEQQFPDLAKDLLETITIASELSKARVPSLGMAKRVLVKKIHDVLRASKIPPQQFLETAISP